MRIVCLSDTHTYHRRVKVPDGDVLILAGDFSSTGEKWTVEDVSTWLGKLPHTHKIVIAGNHECTFDPGHRRYDSAVRPVLKNCIYLEDSGVEIEGVKFWGSPWQPWFYNWAFNLKDPLDLESRWTLIPDDTQVLITHGPPQGILDLCPDGSRVGCDRLLERVRQIKPKLHVFGHIHHSHGRADNQGIVFVNAAICDEDYNTTNQPIVVDIDV